MPPQVSAVSITDAHLLDQGGIVQTALPQIADRFRMAVELELIEGGRLLQQPGNGSGWDVFRTDLVRVSSATRRS